MNYLAVFHIEALILVLRTELIMYRLSMPYYGKVFIK